MKSRGFSVHIDGRPKTYPAGADVPAEVVEEFGLIEKGLVERDPVVLDGSRSGSRKRKKKTVD